MYRPSPEPDVPSTADDPPVDEVPTASAAMRSNYGPVVIDIVVSGILPTIAYHWLTTSRGWSEAQALGGVIVFPAAMSVWDLVRDRCLNIINAMSLIGIVMGLGAAWMGGDPKMLLIRESLFTVLFGAVALASLLLPRPLLYWMARAAMQRQGADTVRTFEERYAASHELRRLMKAMTAACGALFVFEFGLKVLMVYTLSVETVLVTGPIVFNVVSLGGMGAIVLYGRMLIKRATRRPLEDSGAWNTAERPSF